MAQLYPSFEKGLAPFFGGNWGEYSDFLTFKGGLNPVTGSLWLSDIAHHHLALAVLFIFAGHMYRTNWGIGHSMKEILEAHKGPFTGEGHKGLYEILTTSWHAQLAINLSNDGIIKYYCCTSYVCNATISLHCNGLCNTTFIIYSSYVDWWILCCWWSCSCFIFLWFVIMTPANNYNNLLDRVIRHRDAIISHLNWVCIFLGFHSFGLYIHNDTMRALGSPQDMFSDKAISITTNFCTMDSKYPFISTWNNST